jgi:hypothetical protein
MSAKQPFDRPTVYRIKVKAHLADQWSDWFEGLTITHEPNGETLLCGLVSDQAALYGLLKKVRDLGLGLIAVSRIECDLEKASAGSAGKGDICDRCQLTKSDG